MLETVEKREPFALLVGMQIYTVTNSDGKASSCNAGDLGLIAGSGRSPGGGNSNPLQHSSLENPVDRGA